MAEFYHSSMKEELIIGDLNIEARLEALLFIAPSEVSLTQLASAMEIPRNEVKKGLKSLDEYYSGERTRRGLRIQWHGSMVQLTSAPESAYDVERLLGLEIYSKLSKASLETLAIIAYKQPVTRPEIDSIRGVNSDGVLRGLLIKGFIMEVGRTDSPGRPFLYSTTPDFLQHFGLSTLDDLPPLNLENYIDSAEKT